ncbi:MAG: type III PLP-dependent enzyme [Leifsonia sp.]
MSSALLPAFPSSAAADADRRDEPLRRSDAAVPHRPGTQHREAVRVELARYAERISLFAIVRSHGSPLLVLDPTRIHEQIRLLRQELPAAEIHFATKALPHPAAIGAVAAAGAGFEVASRGEIALLARQGVDVGRCLHSHPIRSRTDIVDAYLAGVRHFVVDNHRELVKLAVLPRDIDVLVRLSYPNPDAGCDLSAKFGSTPAQACELVRQAVGLGVAVAGFSFHVGSQTTSSEPFEWAITRTSALMDELERELGIRFRVLDIGGGFPIGYDEPVPSLAVIASGIRAAIRASGRRDRLLLEPGRFIAATAMTLVSRVVGSSDRVDGRWHYLDDGLYGSYSNVLTEQVHPLVFAASELTGGEPARRETVTLAGPTCDSVDVIARSCELPALTEGDLVVSPMMGAYTSVTASGFNGIDPTPIHVLRSATPASPATPREAGRSGLFRR